MTLAVSQWGLFDEGCHHHLATGVNAVRCASTDQPSSWRLLLFVIMTRLSSVSDIL